MSADRIPYGLGFVVAFLGGIVLHSLLTAKVAEKLGDRSQRLMGRANLSIKSHIDSLGTLIIPAVFTLGAFFGNVFVPLVGWGRQHLISPRAFRKPKRDIIIVALIGPLVTLALAGVGGMLFRVGQSAGIDALGQLEFGLSPLGRFGAGLTLVASFLTLLELLPLPGRDGGRILQRFLSPTAAMKMEDLIQYEALFVLAILIFDRIVGGTVVAMTDPICRLVSGVGCRSLA